MFTLFAHAGHSHESMDSMNAIDHCMPIIVGAGIIIVILVAIIVCLLAARQPKHQTKASKVVSKKK